MEKRDGIVMLCSSSLYVVGGTEIVVREKER